MIEIIKALLPVALKLITLAIEKKILSDEEKRHFLEFIETLTKKDNISTRSRDDFRRIRDRIVSSKST